ncbi:Mak10 subunit, NatC N-terminal acetyltransferase-domain-containing protein [Flammula alnicola]|nr:Mak10 subunit, NatC N-terminal acetyltransferase-domain-containing protein [Flammula alnicola]
MASAIPIECEIPGAGYDFQDVTSLFVEAAAELEPDNLLFMENFTLQESMSALEIGEPRLDSGLIVHEQLRPPFDPMTPLLPEELCWILDRSLAYETEFHAGNFLAHTVHTLLYVHHLSDIDPDVIPSQSTLANDPSRPIELVTIVLRSAVQGLLKCCDLAWRELARGGAYDTEDWQSDKCEVSLLEGMPVPFVVSKLDEAADWLSDSTKVPTRWKTALRARLLLRKTLIQVMSTDPTKDRFEFQKLVFVAKDYLHTVEANPTIDIGPDSPAQLAFDPYIGRRLQMATPIRVVPPPSFDQTCKILNYFLDGLYEVGLLETVDDLSTWEVVGNLRLWLPGPPLRVPYLRSMTQTTFYDGFLLLNKYSFEWMINRFFVETIGVNYDSIRAAVVDRWTGGEDPPMKRVERSLYKLITPHFRALWNNPPRRRRHFMKALMEWHSLYDTLVQITDNLDVEDLPRGHLMTQLPVVALLWRLSIVREVVLSGFQLELYAKEERSFAYWYAVQVIDAHLNCLDNVLHVVQEGSPVHREMLYQIQFLTALQSLCTALSLVSMPLMSFDWDRTRPNFFRRYKWAFRAEYDAYEAPVIAPPELHEFIRTCGEILTNGDPIPAEPVALARSILTGLVDSNNTGGWAGLWAKDRMQLARNLLSVCDNLSGLPQSAEQMDVFDAKALKWDPAFHPWFPRLVPASTAA